MRRQVGKFSRPHAQLAAAACALFITGKNKMWRIQLALGWAAIIGLGPSALAQPSTQTIEIVGTSPLPGQGVSRDLLPYNTQVVRRGALDAAQADNATDFMARRMTGVQVNDIQGSPFQGDLTFRGFRASGILGASQGMSVYLDGVRINEPFGDVVNWDLVPEFALDSIALVPAANPAFGLNTLGGAIAMTTASGRSAPGARGELSFGSFGRKRADMSFGTSTDNWHAYVGAGLFDERGWRDFSDGRLGTVVGKLGRSTDVGEFALNVLAGRSTLVGNGLVPLFTFDDDGERTPDIGASRRQAVYTHPDETRNRLTQASVTWRHTLATQLTAEALVYARRTQRTTINGDEADESATPPLPGDPNASFNRTATRQRAVGAAFALSGKQGAHQWQVGVSADRSNVRYEQTEQEGLFDDTRGVQPIAGEEAELSAAVRGRSTQLGLYATDTWRMAERTHVTATVRANQARVANTLTSVDDDTGDVEERPRESFRYRSLNPALGVAQGLGDGVTVFANIARNTRVPTVIELGCADPEEPCRLPAGLQADPYLKQVRSVSLEAGLRFGSQRGGNGGSVALFRTDNRDDILFRSTSVVGQLGYFQNFERTRHQGLDAEWHSRIGPIDLGVAYSHLQATYQADGVLRIGERNVPVARGTRIAGLPRNLLKLSADWQALPGLTLGADVQAHARRGVAGNEDGRIEDGGDTGIDMSVPGYALFNLRAAWKPASVQGLEFFARVTNLSNRRGASFGALAETQFDASGAFTGDGTDALFVAPLAPRAFSLGLRLKF
jgi:TonB dependent receptor/TonB-dependent Receptor Plug Domain